MLLHSLGEMKGYELFGRGQRVRNVGLDTRAAAAQGERIF